jgi:hypothetical protein
VSLWSLSGKTKGRRMSQQDRLPTGGKHKWSSQIRAHTMRDCPKVGELEEDIPDEPSGDDPPAQPLHTRRGHVQFYDYPRPCQWLIIHAYSIHDWGFASRAVHSLSRPVASEEISGATPTKSHHLTQEGMKECYYDC